MNEPSQSVEFVMQPELLRELRLTLEEINKIPDELLIGAGRCENQEWKERARNKILGAIGEYVTMARVVK